MSVQAKVVSLPSAVRRRIMRLLAPRALKSALAELPPAMQGPLEHLLRRRLDDPVDQERAERVERLRAGIAARPGTAAIYYSPLPGSSGSDHSAAARPRHGEVVQFDWSHIATRTSIHRQWGEFLYLAAKARNATSVLELGSCAGVSGAYMASAPSVERLTSVEASADLATVARETIQSVLPDAVVINALFDEALDQLVESGATFDLAWIDGHHEKIATLHYFVRSRPILSPGAWVLFDDIAWSGDMREAWRELSAAPGVRYALDLGRCGLLILGDGGLTKLDLRPLSGTGYAVGRPHGWKTDA